jgi:hypothetical protein
LKISDGVTFEYIVALRLGGTFFHFKIEGFNAIKKSSSGLTFF